MDNVKSLSYDQRASLTPAEDQMDRQIDALVTQWVAAGRKFPSESEEQYRKSRALLTESLDALCHGPLETWGTTKDETTIALQNMRGTLHALNASARKI